MNDCGDNSGRIDLLVDGELTGAEEAELRAHLAGCERCRLELEAAQALSAAVRAERLQPAPEELCARIEGLVRRQRSIEEADRGVAPVQQTNRDKLWLVPRLQRGALAHAGMRAAAGVAIVVSLFFGARYEHNRSRAREFVLAAVAEQRDMAGGAVPLGVSSASPEVVTAWFSSRMPFKFRMPNSGIASENRAKYVLEGGRITSFHGQSAALLAFKMASQTVSILVASETQARATGGTTSHSDSIEFHSIDVDQHHVVTWDTKGLTYALVSDQPMARRSCSACHMEAGVPVPRQARIDGPVMRVLGTPPL